MCAKVDSQCLEYLEYMTLYPTWNSILKGKKWENYHALKYDFLVQQQKSGQNEWRTLQLVLPVSDPHQPRTLYLCHGSGQDPQGPTQGGPVWTHMGVAFSLPKVTPNEVLNVDNEYYTDEEYILERPKGNIFFIFLLNLVCF